MLINVKNESFGTKYIVTFKVKYPKIEGIVAVHDTKLGPAMGGCRIYDELSFNDGLKDAVKLAKAMTYKNAIAGLPYGGGKAVIIKHGLPIDNVMTYFAKIMNLLNGEYLTTEDVGTNSKNIDFLRKYTKYALGAAIGEQFIPATAYGVYQSIKATIYFLENRDNIQNLKIAVQGLGKVGFDLCKFLRDAGCILYVCDINKELEKTVCKNFGAQTFEMENIEHLDIDVFSPCALGNVITRQNYSKFKAKYIIGGANNPLSNDSVSDLLYKRGTIYMPDFLTNAGGVIEAGCENCDFEYNEINILPRIEDIIYNKTINLLDEAKSLKLTPLQVAQNWVNNILQS